AGLLKDGTEFPVDGSLCAVETYEGVLVAAVVRDVTGRGHAEGRLRERNAELERANRAKDGFLAAMSRELRTPLNAVIGFTGILLMRLPGPLTDEQEQQLRMVQASAKSLLGLVNDLVELARIESGNVRVSPERVDCRE